MKIHSQAKPRIIAQLGLTFSWKLTELGGINVKRKLKSSFFKPFVAFNFHVYVFSNICTKIYLQKSNVVFEVYKWFLKLWGRRGTLPRIIFKLQLTLNSDTSYNVRHNGYCLAYIVNTSNLNNNHYGGHCITFLELTFRTFLNLHESQVLYI